MEFLRNPWGLFAIGWVALFVAWQLLKLLKPPDRRVKVTVTVDGKVVQSLVTGFPQGITVTKLFAIQMAQEKKWASESFPGRKATFTFTGLLEKGGFLGIGRRKEEIPLQDDLAARRFLHGVDPDP